MRNRHNVVIDTFWDQLQMTQQVTPIEQSISMAQQEPKTTPPILKMVKGQLPHQNISDPTRLKKVREMILK